MKKTRLIGIDLCRGIATYAVIVVHSGDQTWGLPISPNAIYFRLLFYFAVPFFLLTSFYFMCFKISEVYAVKFWKPKIDRILIPYIFWSIIYFLLRAIFFAVARNTDRFQQILQDPLSIFCFGGASYQLYFLPLLFTGTFLTLLLPVLISLKIKEKWLIGLSLLSVVAYELLIFSGNEFHLGVKSIALEGLFQASKIDPEYHPILRFIAVEISWLVKCSPYVLIAFLIKQMELCSKLSKANPLTLYGLLGLFIFSDTFGRQHLLPATSELILAVIMLLLGFVLSGKLESLSSKLTSLNQSIQNLGLCSFGIYLIHPLIMNVVKPILGKLIPTLTHSITIYSMLVLSSSCFLMSWLIVSFFCKNRIASKYLFGA